MAFLHNLDEIVTRDHLDSRLVQMEARINERFAVSDGKLRLLFWMQGLTIAVIVLPSLAKILG